MKIKKTIALFAVCTLVGANLIPIAASAHGGRHHNRSNSSSTVCTITDCHKSGRHTHNGTRYASRCSTYNHNHHN